MVPLASMREQIYNYLREEIQLGQSRARRGDQYRRHEPGARHQQDSS